MCRQNATNLPLALQQRPAAEAQLQPAMNQGWSPAQDGDGAVNMQQLGLGQSHRPVPFRPVATAAQACGAAPSGDGPKQCLQSYGSVPGPGGRPMFSLLTEEAHVFSVFSTIQGKMKVEKL